MTFCQTLARLFCVSISLLAGAAEVTKPEKTAALLSAEGTVELMRAGSSNWSPATNGTPLVERDRLRTGGKARASVRLFDSSIIRIGPLTTFELLPSDDKPVLDLKAGSIYFFSRQKPEDIRFRTPTVSGAIRGTEFTLSVDEKGASEVALIDGQVALQQIGIETILNSGEKAIASSTTNLVKQPLLNAKNVVQWVLYYPAVVNPADLQFTDAEKQAIAKSIEAYSRGDLIRAAALIERAETPGAAFEIYWAQLGLSFGDLKSFDQLQDRSTGRALKLLTAAVQFLDRPSTNVPGSASEWMGESYFRQSRGDLDGARTAVAEATKLAPDFGFAWIRLAELEFAHGNLKPALAALERGLELSPEHAPGHALRGFIYSAQNRRDHAGTSFSRAIELNGALGSAWLGRGLVKMKSGDVEGGRIDIQTAVALEPQRAVFRAYLAKAFSEENRSALAEKDLRLARELDAADPTAWLYSGLLSRQQNKINSAIGDLQKSAELNNNQQIHRSTFLLDQDRATKGANLASVYRDANMLPVSLSQAARSVSCDYANYSTHLFLTQSYDLLRDPNKYNLRYETARLSELYLASLLSPVGGFTLSQNAGSQDTTRLFERNRLGLSSETEYLSRGAWTEAGSQFGTYENFAYSIDAFYRTDNGQRPNNDTEQRTLSAQAKFQLNYRDSVFFQALQYEAESGDVVQRFDQSAYNPDIRVREVHEPDAFIGFHREWQPGNHTLLLVGRSDLLLEVTDPDAALLFFRRQNGEYTRIAPAPFHHLEYDRDYELYSAEAQQIWQTGRHTFIVGARYQTAETETSAQITDLFQQPVSVQDQDNDFNRFSVYAYYQWEVLDSLQITAGLSYDDMHYPRNVDTAPLSQAESGVQQLSPKAGIQYSPWRNGTFRGAFTRSLGGFSLDNNLRLEPTQVGGFNQAYRSLIPESVAGITYGEQFQTISAGYDHSVRGRTFFGIEAERLSSHTDRWFGILTAGGFFPVPDTPANTFQQLEFVERALRLYGYQLLGRDFVAGAQYRLGDAELDSRAPEVSAALPERLIHLEATLHEVLLNLTWNHPSGFFSQFDSAFYAQDNQSLPNDQFWQHNIFIGYRFRKRAAELRLGVLNLASQDYQLNPLNVHLELPRERTFTARLRLNF